MKRIYIAGPMTGHADLNYPAFHAKAATLRAAGWHVENPAENPEPPCGTWLGYMRMALVQLATCDAIYMLPGHERSRGATIELNMARGLGLEVLPADMASAPRSDGLLDQVADWFRAAVPVPTHRNRLSQLGCHFEEVHEMLVALGGNVPEMKSVADELKAAAADDNAVSGFEQVLLPRLDRAELLDALCDQIVTATGVAHMMGLDLQGALAEVNRANWSKFENGQPVFNDQGKIAKGRNYMPPMMAPFVGPLP